MIASLGLIRPATRQAIAFAHRYRDAVNLMAHAMEDLTSALHASRNTVRDAGSRLLQGAQAKGLARPDMDGADLLALIAALGWLNDQPAECAACG